MTALQAYVCWRMDAGVVGCWALLLLGLATERVGATNAVVAAMHKKAAAARVRGMVIARLQRFGLASQALRLASVLLAASLRPGLPTVPCGVVLACRNALGSWE
jgi:hypothetical protein